MENVKMWNDGNRLILVFENVSVTTKSLIQNMVGAVCSNIPDVAPIKTEESVMPDISAIANGVQLQSVPEINETKLLQEKGFEGLCELYAYYAKYSSKLAPERKNALHQLVMANCDFYKKRDVTTIPDAELIAILRDGAKYMFPQSMNKCLQQSGFISLEDFLASGRQNLVDAYLACFRC